MNEVITLCDFFLQNFQQNQMVNQQQGPNQLDTSANLLQQQHNFDVQVSEIYSH